MIFGQTITGKRYNNGHQSVTLRRDTTTLGSGGSLTTTGEGTNQSVSRNTTGRYASNAIASYREAESVNSDNTITYTYTDLEGWQATEGHGTTSGSRSWSFSYRPPEVVTPVYTGDGSENDPYSYHLANFLVGTGYQSESASGSYSDNYSGKTSYDTTSKSWSLTEGTGDGKGSVISSRHSWVDAAVSFGYHIHAVPIPNSAVFVKYYAPGNYNSSNAVSKGTIFTSTFTVENGQWKSLFEGRDDEYTYANYSMNAFEVLNIVEANNTETRIIDFSGSETTRTSQRTDWSTISGTKATIQSIKRSDTTREIAEYRYVDIHKMPFHTTSEDNRTVNLVVSDFIVSDANGIQQRTYKNDAIATSFYNHTNIYEYNNINDWAIIKETQNAVLSKTSPSANYTITNVITYYTSTKNMYPYTNLDYTDTVNYCTLSLSRTGVNSHYTHAAITYVNSVELTFGANGAGITFGGPTVIPGGFTSENFDHQVPKREPPPPIPPGSPALTSGIPVAGIEIGDKIRELLDELEAKFAAKFKGLSYEQKLEIINNTFSMSGWDIDAFFDLGKDGGYDEWFNNLPDDMKPLLGSITIDGKPYWAAEANYILWGFANRMFHEHLLEAGGGKTIKKYYPGLGLVPGPGITVSHYVNPEDGSLGPIIMTLGDALLWVKSWRSAWYGICDGRFFKDNPLPERRSTGAGLKGRLDFTKVGWDYYGKGPGKRGDFSIPPGTQISDRPVQANPCKLVNDKTEFDFSLYIGGGKLEATVKIDTTGK